MLTRCVMVLSLAISAAAITGCENSNRSSSADEVSSQSSRKAGHPTKPIVIEDGNWEREVLKSDELVLVDFWAPWCGPCRAMEPIMESLAKDYKVCKVNVDSNIDLASEYKIDAIPQFMIFKNGKMVYQHTGAQSEATLRAEMKKRLENAN